MNTNSGPVAGVDVSLGLSLSLGAVSLLLGGGGADGPRAGAHAARARWVALHCGVSVRTAAARHWKVNTKHRVSVSAH